MVSIVRLKQMALKSWQVSGVPVHQTSSYFKYTEGTETILLSENHFGCWTRDTERPHSRRTVCARGMFQHKRLFSNQESCPVKTWEIIWARTQKHSIALLTTALTDLWITQEGEKNEYYRVTLTNLSIHHWRTGLRSDGSSHLTDVCPKLGFSEGGKNPQRSPLNTIAHCLYLKSHSDSNTNQD